MPTRHSPFAYLAFVAGLLLAWYWSGGFESPGRADREAMIGTWTEEAGPPGNSIRFYYVVRDIPGISYAQAYEGHATLVKQLGEDEAAAQWNYGSTDPLVLNFGIGHREWYVAVRKIDDDHILVRFGTDAEEMYRPGAIDHPDARLLTRSAREPRP
jgi:hypothetical protein